MSEIICDYEETIWGKTEMRFGPFKMLPTLKFELLESDIKNGFSEGKIVLESGCGGGMYIEELSRSMNDNKYFGTDFSMSAIRDVSKENTIVKYFISDSMIMPVKDKSIDVLLLLDIVEHVDEPENVFAEAKRILKIDGIMHLNIPVEANKTTIFWLLGKIFRKNFQKKYSGHIHSYSLNEVKNLLDKYQFKVADINYYYHFIGQLTQFILYFAKYLKEVLLKKENSLKITGIDKSFITGMKDDYYKGKNKEKFKLSNLLSVKFYIRKTYYLFRVFQNVLLVAAYYESKILKNFSFISSCISARVVKKDFKTNVT